MNRRRRFFAILLAACAVTGVVWTEEPSETAERMRWFDEARFGFFVHFGVYSALGGEWDGQQTSGGGENIQFNLAIPWTDYTAVAEQFVPSGFDAAQWIAAAKDAGMKYVVVTTKHHDGFALYDSAYTDWDMTRSPWLDSHADPIQQLADEARAQGLKFGTYYSLMDWYHHYSPATGSWLDFTDAQQRQQVHDQVTELIQRFDPDMLWFDAFWLSYWSHADGEALYDHIRTLKPSMIVNNRVAKAGFDDGDYVTMEGVLAPPDAAYPWEAAFTMNRTWGYRHFDDEWKSSQTLLHLLLYAAGQGANYLLNVGPTGEGLVPQESLDRLADIGQWMDTYGEAIYATAGSPFGIPRWGWATTKPGRLYLLVAEWPDDGRLRFPALRNDATAAYLLEDPQRTPLALDVLGKEWTVTVPATEPNALASVVVVEVDGPPHARPLDQTPYVTVNDTDPSVTYHGSHWWYNGNRPYWDHMRDVHASLWNAPNDGSVWMEFEFEGTGIGYVTERNVDQGAVDVYVDDEFVATVDTGHPSIRMTQIEVFRKLGLSNGTHRLKLVKRGGLYFLVDAFRVYRPTAGSGEDPPRPVEVQRAPRHRHSGPQTAP